MDDAINHATALKRLTKQIPSPLRLDKIIRVVEMVYLLGCTDCGRVINLNDGMTLEIDRRIENNFYQCYVTLLCCVCSSRQGHTCEEDL